MALPTLPSATGSSPSRRRAAALSLLSGAVHAATVVLADRALDYPIAALGRGPVEWAFFVGGAVLVAAVPTFLALRNGLLAPVAAFLFVAATSLVAAAVGPRPAFSELGGHTVVAGTLHLRNYVQGWYCWLLAGLLAGLAEYVARVDVGALPAPRRRVPLLDVTDRRGSLRVAAAVGVGHLVAVVLLAAESRYFAPGSSFAAPLVLAWTLPGAVALAAVPAYLLARHRLLAPLAAFTWFFYRVARVQFLPMPDDALPVYLIGWPAFVAAAVAVGVAESLFRRAIGRFAGRPRAA
jgi:hypothetical protein